MCGGGQSLRRPAAEAGDLVPVGRGGERRAIAHANPSLGGRPFATTTLWAAIQYLMPGEDAPEHQHTQHPFRFASRASACGPLSVTTRYRCHATAEPMAWIDGLDIPLQYVTESQFFEFGRDEISETERMTPERSHSERT